MCTFGTGAALRRCVRPYPNVNVSLPNQLGFGVYVNSALPAVRVSGVPVHCEQTVRERVVRV